MTETTYQGLIEDLENYLEYQRDEGVQLLEVDRAVLAELTKEPEVVVPEEVVMEAAPIPSDFKTLAEMAAHISSCTNCELCQTRTHTVPGEGKSDAPDILFVGEWPGAEEDAQGRPFVGKPGQLLGKMIEAMGYSREEVFITTTVKCSPKGRRLKCKELEPCLPYLQQQIKLIQPKTIVALGSGAVQVLLGKTIGLSRMRGNWQEVDGIKLMPTFDPSYLLRDPSKKKDAWTDLKKVLAELGKTPPARK